MVDLDSNPTKLIEIVEVGKQLLITRGALTTFSIANDVAKYFAILPAMFAATYAAAGQKGPLDALNIMSLGTPQSAILSAVIFNALIIPLLIPLSLRGVRYRPIGATGAAAPQHADLRARRVDRPVHRHQADRPDRPQPAGGVSVGRRLPTAPARSGWCPPTVGASGRLAPPSGSAGPAAPDRARPRARRRRRSLFLGPARPARRASCRSRATAAGSPTGSIALLDAGRRSRHVRSSAIRPSGET